MLVAHSEATRRPKVVVVGGGFGGLEAAKALASCKADVILVDENNHHCFQPLLYQVATAALSPADIAWPIRFILRHQKNVEVLLSRVEGIDRQLKAVKTSSGEIAYDYLILATGATHHYFGHPEWSRVAPGLKKIEDATRIRSHILRQFEEAELAKDEATQHRLMTFVIVGGGATGVEMAGAIAELARQTLGKDFRHIRPSEASILLLEAGPRLLLAFPSALSSSAERALVAMGVDVRTRTAVTSCNHDSVEAGGTLIPAGTIVWAAGVKASPVADWLEVPHDRSGRVPVAPDLSVPGDPDVFVIGDAAAVTVNGEPVPGVAPAAKQMGRYVGQLLANRIAGGKRIPPFTYRDYGALATVGRKFAVGTVGRLRLSGFTGWAFWSVVHIYYLVGARNRLLVVLNWVWSYATFQRGARLIIGTEPPPMNGR